MKNLKTVKEVCELTGLNRKLLYIYDKEGIVKPSSHQNNAHEGMAKKARVKVNYDGYKLYDDEAIRKLQQIAIYEKLHMKRCDIKARFTSKEINTSELLDEQIQLLQQKKKEIEELLIVAEQLKLLGMKGELTQYYASIDFSEFAQNVAKWQASQSMKIFAEVLTESTNEFEAEADEVLDELLSLSEQECESEKAREMVKELLTIAKKHFGFVGWLTIIFMSICVEGGGEVLTEVSAEIGEKPVVNSSKAVFSYFKYDMDILWEEYIEILVKYYEVIGKDYTEPKVKEMVDEVKEMLFIHTGLYSKDEYQIFFEFMQLSPNIERNSYRNFVLRAMEYYYKNA